MQALKSSSSRARSLEKIYKALSDELGRLAFSEPVTHVYNPLEYAWDPASAFFGLASPSGQQNLLLGMNPGPWGMAQTGVPFGTVEMVTGFLGIRGVVGKPPLEHPKRPITGFDTQREEVSGTRFWGWARDRYGSPKAFFEHFFVANYCPLVFMESSGRNRTPDKLALAERKRLFEYCDRALMEVVDVLQPARIIGIGKFAEDRARLVLGDRPLAIDRILHPSPASPLANRGWAQQAQQQLQDLGID